jgi:hypothetical protein
MQMVLAVVLAILFAAAAAGPGPKACGAGGPASSCEDAEEAALLQHQSTTKVPPGQRVDEPAWYVERLYCEGGGSHQQFWLGECTPAVSMPDWSVKYECTGPSMTGFVTTYLYEAQDCIGSASPQTVQQGVCEEMANGVSTKLLCYPNQHAFCSTADFHQYNLPGVQSYGVKSYFNGMGLIFSWLDGGDRKMVLTDLQGNAQKTGYVSQDRPTFWDTNTWTERPASTGYSISNFQSGLHQFHCW